MARLGNVKDAGAHDAPEIDEDELPDSRLLWRWVGKATRPVVGWVLIAAGGIAILAGYWGVSREALVAKQIPYLVSGGIGGMVLVAVGAFFLGTEDLRKELVRLRRLERLVEELHSTLLEPLGGAPTVTRPAAKDTGGDSERNGATRLVTLAGTNTYHMPGCRMVEGKQPQAVAAATVRRRHLEPCRLCEPVLADA
jgi:hypothetical protein